MITSMIASSEYYARSSSTNDGFIRAVYVSLLGRPASDQDVSAWRSTVAGPNGRAVAALEIETSREARDRTTDQLYARTLLRAATAADRATWFNAMQNGSNYQSQELAIMASPEALAVANH